MAAPTYTHDLTDWIADSDTSAWAELTGANAGALPDEADTESALQGTNTVSQANNTTGLCGIGRDMGSDMSLSTGDVVLIWHGHGVATALLSYASGGLQVAFGSGVADWKSYYVAGNDTHQFPYGKWLNSAVDPSYDSDNYDLSNGTPPTGLTGIQLVGSICQLSQAVAKGQPHVVDIIRYGRAEAQIYGGELISDGDASDNPATFDGYATLNDATSARWGLIQKASGGYLWKGLMSLGLTASLVKFQDSNKDILIDDTRKTYSSFNKVEVNHASSIVNWTGVNFKCLSPTTTASKGDFEVIDNASVTLDGCSFTDMNTFVFQSNSSVDDTTFRRCAAVATGGGTFDGCLFTKSTATSAVTATSPANAALVTNSTFISAGTGHGLEITGTAANATLTNCTWTGYAATDGSTGNEAVYVNIASGSMNLTISGGTTPSIRTAGCSVTVISGAVSATVKTVNEAGTAISGANVHLEATTGGPFPVAASVTIVNSGTTATVTHSSHGLSTNDKVVIRGASHNQNLGVHSITVTGTNTYTYTMASDPGSSPTGTITSTFVVLNGTTDVNGEVSMSRVFPSNQPTVGRARKSSSSPYYKNSPLTGTVNSSTGAYLTAVMISDE